MPFTPFHMGPGIAIKAAMQKRFSLMVFGWSQIVIDLQPLIVMLTNKGELHGYTHTYIGATLIGFFCALSGKYLDQIGWRVIREPSYLPINGLTAFLSAYIGTYSHVFLDSIMHSDIKPFAPFSTSNSLYGIISIESLHVLCIICAILGSIVFFIIKHLRSMEYGSKKITD